MRWVVGDIHGMLRCAEPLLTRVRALDPAAELLFTGDYINRGPDARGVIELVLGLDGRARFIRGNHDDIFDLVLHGTCYAPHPDVTTPGAGFRWFMQHGLAETFKSYGASETDLERAMRRPNASRLKVLADHVPEAHRRFIRELPPVIEMDDCFVLHAWWSPVHHTKSPGIAERLEENPSLRRPILWERYSSSDIENPKPWWRTGFFGHTPVLNYRALIEAGENIPLEGPGMVLLDTGAALGSYGRLTAYCVERHRFIQVDHEGAPVDERWELE